MKLKPLTAIGITLTVAYLATLGVVILNRWEELNKLGLNELGDFLAGSIGPLALLWLVAGYFQQGEELNQNTAALKLQAEELRLAVEQHRDLADATREQNRITTDQFAFDRQRDKESRTPKLWFGISDVELTDSSILMQIGVINGGALAKRISIHVSASDMKVESSTLGSVLEPAAEAKMKLRGGQWARSHLQKTMETLNDFGTWQAEFPLLVIYHNAWGKQFRTRARIYLSSAGNHVETDEAEEHG